METLTESGHLSEESLGLHAMGDSSVFGGIRVEAHLTECIICRSHFQEMAQTVAALRSGALNARAAASFA